MSSKGFSLIELLGSITIVALLVTITVIGYTKYRANALQDDLLNLHSTIETEYNNYRKDLILKGDNVPNTIVIGSEKADFDKYFSALAYNGSHINKSSLKGTIINLRTKGEVLTNTDYYNNASSRAQKKGNGTTANDIYVIDGTCMVNSSVIANSNSVKKVCQTDNYNNLIPSKDEIICIKVKYNNKWIIDDYGTEKNATSFNKLCKYMVVNNE